MKIIKFILLILLFYIIYIILKKSYNGTTLKKNYINNLNNLLYQGITLNKNNLLKKKITKTDINKEKKNYKECINNNNKPAIIHLARLYRDIQHDYKKAIYYYELAIKNGIDISIIELANLHMWGMPGYDGDIEQAVYYYKMILNKDVPNIYKILAKETLENINKNNFDENCLEETNFDNNHFHDNNDYYDFFRNMTFIPTNFNVKQPPRQQPPRQQNTFRIDLNDIALYGLEDELLRNDINPFINIVEILPIHVNNNPNNIRNDRQNVHDHVVQNSVKSSVKKLKKNTKMNKNFENTLSDIKYELNKDKKKYKDAIDIIHKIENDGDKKLLHTNMSEQEALCLVWNRIHDKKNDDNREELKKNLYNELKECKEHGHVVCPTGRFNRIIDSLNVLDKDVKIVPQWALNKEMMTKAGKIRKNMIDQESEHIKKALEEEEPNKEQTKICENFKKKFENNLKHQFEKDYVSSGLMSKDLLNTEMNKWINHI